jgi:hypothetical protein
MAGISQRESVYWSLVASLLCTLLIIVVAVVFHEGAGTYLQFGPNQHLVLMGVRINTWIKWSLCLALICAVRGTQTIVGELGTTVLGFSVYNPQAKVITEFTKNELQFCANAMFTLGSIQGVMMSLVNVTQFDLALCSVMFSEFVSLFTIRKLLNGKTFTTKKSETEDKPMLGDENL